MKWLVQSSWVQCQEILYDHALQVSKRCTFGLGKFYGNMLLVDHAGQQSSNSIETILSWVVMPFPVLQHYTRVFYWNIHVYYITEIYFGSLGKLTNLDHKDQVSTCFHFRDWWTVGLLSNDSVTGGCSVAKTRSLVHPKRLWKGAHERSEVARICKSCISIHYCTLHGLRRNDLEVASEL